MCWLFSVSPEMHPLLFLALLCVQEAGTTSFAPSIQPMPEEGWGIILHLPSRQVMVFPVAVLLRNGCDLGQAASLPWLQPLPDSCYTAPFCLL